MGFKFKRFDYVGGSGTWGSSTTRVQRSQAVLKDFADWLISNNGLHWTLDTTRNATTSSFVDVPVWNISKIIQTDKYPGLFFINTESGCKLFIAVLTCSSSYSIAVEREYITNNLNSSSSIAFASGIVMSMIPDGNDNFGSSFDNSFLPSSATRLIGTVSSSYAVYSTYIGSNSSGYQYSYGLFATDYCVGIGGEYSYTSAAPQIKPGYFVGRVIGSLAHEENTNQAKYGAIRFCSGNVNNENCEFAGGFRYFQFTSLYFIGAEFTTSVSAASNLSSIFAANGNPINNSSTVNVRYYPADIQIFTSNTINSTISGKLRWVPLLIAACASDLANYGVVPGDGMKGYLDTDLFRCTTCTLNQLYANGSFIGAQYNLMLGWDTSNTDSL